MDEIKNKSAEREPLTKTITIPLAEYFKLVRAATMLDVILYDTEYNHQNVVGAVGRALEAYATLDGVKND